MKYCVLTPGKVCDDCGGCDDRCELDPTKICDNCFRCLDEMTANREYSEIPISAVYTDEDGFAEVVEPTSVYSETDKPTLLVHKHYYDVVTLYGVSAVRRKTGI